MSKSNSVKNRTLLYRGTDAQMVGSAEPEWPSFDVQEGWTPGQRHMAMGRSFNWYRFTQDDRTANTFVAEWLERSDKRKPLANAIRKNGNILPTYGWMCRCASMGLRLTLGDLRKLHQVLTKFALEQAEQASAHTTPSNTVRKPTIQDHINEKMRECMGEIQGQIDEFVANDCTGDPKVMASLIKFNVPQVRVKELASRLERQQQELELARAGTDPDLTEGYSQFGKRQLNRFVDWIKTAQEQIWSYGTMKAANRKPKVRKGQTPQKMVSKLRFLSKSTELKVESIDPTQILKASELWVYHVKKRKLGVYIADTTQSSLYVKGSKLMGYSETLSVWKTLRKPETQIAELMKAGKPASKKWFEDIKAVESKMNGRITEEILLLKAYK
jgi:hypothetical protein